MLVIYNNSSAKNNWKSLVPKGCFLPTISQKKRLNFEPQIYIDFAEYNFASVTSHRMCFFTSINLQICPGLKKKNIMASPPINTCLIFIKNVFCSKKNFDPPRKKFLSSACRRSFEFWKSVPQFIKQFL